MEIWKDIPNYEGMYQVSSLGRVKSLRFNKEKILKPSIRTDGYLKVGLTKNKETKNITVHLLVATSFLNHKNDGTNKIVVDHINSIKTDNKLKNLQLISNRYNCSKDRKGISKYTGVTWFKRDKKWKAQIFKNNKQIHLGYFNTEIEASKAYQKELKNVS